jgi:hypothetical protein
VRRVEDGSGGIGAAREPLRGVIVEAEGYGHGGIGAAVGCRSGIRERRSGWSEVGGVAGDALGDADVVEVAVEPFS